MASNPQERRAAKLAAQLGAPAAQCLTEGRMHASVNAQETSAVSHGEISGEEVQKIFEADGIKVNNGAMTNKKTAQTLNLWHQALECGFNNRDEEMMKIMDEIMDDNVVFLAPTYWKERRSKEFIKYALVGVSKAFKNFKYTRVFFHDDGFALEFEANVETEDGPFLRGVDMVTVDPSTGKITRFEVMCRPPKAVLKLLDFQTAFMRKVGLIPPAKKK